MGFKTWMNKGIAKLQDMYKDYTLMSFDELKAKFDISQKHFFKYLQLKTFYSFKLNSSASTFHFRDPCNKKLFWQKTDFPVL